MIPPPRLRVAGIFSPGSLGLAMQIQDTKTEIQPSPSLSSSWTRNDPLGLRVGSNPRKWIRAGYRLELYAPPLPYDPALAAQWASSINDPKTRNSTLQTVIKNWSRYDPVGAANFTKSHLP